MALGLLGGVLSDIALSGVNFSLAGNGGPECIDYIPPWQRWLETLIFSSVSFYGIYCSIGNLEFGSTTPQPKLTLIFFLNPCHLSTVLQLILLKIPQENHGPWAVQLFRFHLYTVPGALMALAFPILNTRLMIGEMFIYFVQHILIVSVPFYLMSIKDTYSPESLTNYSWPMFSASLLVLYHFLFLQTVSLLTQVNLNCIMCPAVSDPFRGRFYRILAVGHQSLLAVPLLTKLYSFAYLYLTAMFQVEVEQKHSRKNVISHAFVFVHVG
uniref:Transmembrane protein 164 n=1 Tax=Ditylenchus dipsaci TaxID=166011 RepID=A0A915EC16_9BILA